MQSIVAKARELFQGLAAKHDLPYILSQAKPDASLEDRLDWMELLITWLRSPIQPSETTITPLHAPVVRIKFLLQLLERR